MCPFFRMHAYTFPFSLSPSLSHFHIDKQGQKGARVKIENQSIARISCDPIDWIYFEEFVPRAILLWLDFLHTYG